MGTTIGWSVKYLTLCKHNLGNRDFLWVRRCDLPNKITADTKWIPVDDDVADFVLREFGLDVGSKHATIWRTNVGC